MFALSWSVERKFRQTASEQSNERERKRVHVKVREIARACVCVSERWVELGG